MKNKLNKKIAVIILGVVVLAFTVFLLTFRGTLIISSTYNDAKYFLNGKEITQREIKLWPGKHVLLIKKEDYFDQSLDLEVNPYKTSVIKVPLLKQVSADLDDNIKDELKGRISLIRNTPFEAPFGTVEFDYNQDKFIVKLTQGHSKESVLEWFKNNRSNETLTTIHWQ